MLEVEKWAKNKPPLIAVSAIQLVTFSDFLYEVLPQAKERRLFGHQFPLPNLSSWFRLYRSPLKPLIAFVNLIAEFNETGAKLKELTLAALKIFKLLNRNPNYLQENPPSLESVQYWVAIVNNIITQIFADIRDDLNPQPIDPEEKTRFFKYMENNENVLGFFFFLYVPCLLIYQTSPRSIYRKAISGDIEAIEKILKLDPLMLHESNIGQQIQALRHSNKSNDYERLIAAAHKLAITKHKDIDAARKRSKVELAAIISVLCQASGYPLNSPQIAALFDAYSKDKREGEGDADLPGGESFDKAIKRHSPSWQNLLQNLDNKK